MTTIEQLERFCIDKNVKDIQNYVNANKNKFNIFKVLKLDNHEIRHSNFLAWLLNPSENHTLKDKFLQMFLKQAINYNVNYSNDLTVETEYFTNKARRIDILLHSKKSDFVCVIENKYGSNEHDEQCKHYKDFIENHSKFKDYKNKYYIFLDIEKPDKEQLQKALYCYEPITYREIYKILVEILKGHNNFPQEVKQTIEQYKCIIMEKYSMVDEVTKEKCREIFRDYSDVIETLEQYKKGFQNDVHNIMLSIFDDKEINIINADIDGIGENNRAGYNNGTGCGIRFIPVEYENNIDKSRSLNKNKLTKYTVFFSLTYKEKIKLSLIDDKKGKWQEPFSKELNIIGKTDIEIKDEIKKCIRNNKNEYETIVKNY